MSLTTPALLFPAISLLLLAYTNRFLVLAQLIRQLHSSRKDTPDHLIFRQIRGLRKRIQLIKYMQSFGVVSFLLCTGSMFSIFLQMQAVGEFLFGLSILALSTSLVYSLYEVTISTNALSVILEDLDVQPVSRFDDRPVQR
ncbi:MAG: DUF2721 domain-containing protein [Elainellaceae cyanobacterium]